MHRNAADPDLHDFDVESELHALERKGYVFAEPVVARALRVAEVVEALGWQGAVDVLDEAWEGWEADFLPEAVEHYLHAQDVSRRRDDRRFLAQVIGGRRG